MLIVWGNNNDTLILMKIAFFGTPIFAVQVLEELVKSKKHNVVCVVTQPDKPVGRGGKVIYTETKKFALANNIPVVQPEKISREVELLDLYKPDIIVTVAFGQMLRQNILDYAPHGVVNVHTSLLPAYRGSSPVQWAIMKGEKVTGVTIMQTDIGMDTGDIILTKEVEIGDDETSGELLVRLGCMGAELLIEALDKIENNTATRTPQDHNKATHFPMLKKEDGKIDWTKSAGEIVNKVRGLNPWPICYFALGEEIIRVYKANISDYVDKAKVGEVVRADKGGLVVQCGDGSIHLETLQASGGKVLNYKDFLNGRKIAVGAILN